LANLRHTYGGEKVSDGLRVKLRNHCSRIGAGNVNILATYGFTEAKQAWPNVRIRTTNSE